MQLRSVVCIGGGTLLVFLVIWWQLQTNESTTSIFSPVKDSQRQSKAVHEHCKDLWELSEIQDYYESVAVIYDFSTITPERLRDDVTALVTRLNQNLISQIILVNNKCENELASAEAVRLAEFYSSIEVVLLDADETVSTGRARVEGIAKTTAPFLFFISAGHIPDSEKFLEALLRTVTDAPDTIIVPSTSKSPPDETHTLTWSLDIKKVERLRGSRDVQLPLIDNNAFLIRSDLYKTVGGYDSFFFKHDNADRIAFSLSVWLCGGNIIRSKCASLTLKSPSISHSDDDKAIAYLQHAKYIQEVYGGTLADHITYPGIEFYKTSPYDKKAIVDRRQLLTSRRCMTMEWFVHKFNSHFPLKPAKSSDPNYQPVLPVYEKISPQIGRWFVLFAGHCVMVDEDLVLGLSWCPPKLTAQFKFTRQGNGQIKAQEKCVTLRSSDATLAVEDCRKNDNAQIFIYDKFAHQLTAKNDDECITHFNGPNNRQVLKLGPCAGDSPFTKFVFNDEY